MITQRSVKSLVFRANTRCISWSCLRLPNVPCSRDTSYGPHNGLLITHEKLENPGAQGTLLSVSMATAVVLTR
jgi:hypothetical protein